MSFSDLRTLNDLADFLGVGRQLLYRLLFDTPKNELYYSFSIPKKNGDPRSIDAPCDDLKLVQRLLLQKIATQYYDECNAGISHAFVFGRNICSNAKWHKNKRIVVSFDIENFFPSINFGRVLGYFEKNQYFAVKHNVAVHIANLVTFERKLPQGAPTSPIISNLICRILDERLVLLAKKYRMSCTRYADDITFSTNVNYSEQELQEFINCVEQEIISAGFLVNKDKTRIRYSNRRQIVTGICVNSSINVTRDYYKTTRAMAYSLYTKGKFEIDHKLGRISQLQGRFTFIDNVDRLSSGRSDTESRGSHRQDYARFLTYRYCWKNPRIYMFCEGKTDEVYIKAALRALSNQFPALVQYKDNRYAYGIQFFRENAPLNRVLEIHGGGASQFERVFAFYGIDRKMKNKPSAKSMTIIPWFRDKKIHFNSPVVILSDNEGDASQLKVLNDKISNLVEDKEYNGLNITSLRHKLTERPYYRIRDNLYMLTYRTPDDGRDIEIEDLLDWEYIYKKLPGRKFDKKGKQKGEDGYYGKQYLSTFVSRHYKEMDFSKFIDFFENILKLYKDNCEIRDKDAGI